MFLQSHDIVPRLRYFRKLRGHLSPGWRWTTMGMIMLAIPVWDALRILCLPHLLYAFTHFHPSRVCSIQVYKQPILALFPLAFDYSWPKPLPISSPRCPSHFSDLIGPDLPFCEIRDNNCHTFLTLFLMLLRLPSPPSYEHLFELKLTSLVQDLGCKTPNFGFIFPITPEPLLFHKICFI